MALGASSADPSAIFLELGAVFLGLALVARLAHRIGISPIPFYLVAGLAFGEGGLAPIAVGQSFIRVAAEIGVLLLLFALGLEYSARELATGVRRGGPAGLVDVLLNFAPGALGALALGWSPLTALLLGGITFISSSGVISKLLTDLGRLGNRETPPLLMVLVIEDLVMVLYLPIVGVLLAGDDTGTALTSVLIALAAVGAVFVVALRFGDQMSRAIYSRSDEVLLLSLLGLILLAGGVATDLKISAAVGAFLVGIIVSGPAKARGSELIEPLRDLFAAVFFFFFGFGIDTSKLPSAVGIALALAVVTGLTKVATGWWAAARTGVGPRGRMRAGTALVARGEFSIVIAGLGAGATGVAPELGAVAGAYVLILAIVGPILTRFADPLADRLTRGGRGGGGRRGPVLRGPP